MECVFWYVECESGKVKVFFGIRRDSIFKPTNIFQYHDLVIGFRNSKKAFRVSFEKSSNILEIY